MPHPQTWALSQDAKKVSGTCSVCFAVRQLHQSDGTVHLHGPRDNRCPGSSKPPVPSRTSTNLSIPQSLPPTSHNLSISQPLPTTSVDLNTPHSITTTPTNLATPQSLSTTTGSSTASSTSTHHSTILPSSTFYHPSLQAPIIKHIPKSARPACCTVLSRTLNSISSAPNNLKPWSELFIMGTKLFQKPARGGKRHNLANIIKRRADGNDDALVASMPKVGRRKKCLDASASLAAAVSSKIEDGNLSAAVRIISSEDVLAPEDDSTFSALIDKHPTATADRRPLPDPSRYPALQVSESEVLRAIRSFPAGSAGGPDGVRPQHVMDLVSCRESGSVLLTAITAFTNSMLDGKCHPEVAAILFGGNLIALQKKAGGIRPIAVGYTWRRIIAKCAAFSASSKVCQILEPRQLGVGIPGGGVRSSSSFNSTLSEISPR